MAGPIPGRVTVNRASYAQTATATKLDVFATAFPTAQGRLPAGPLLPSSSPDLGFYPAPCATDPVTGAVTGPPTGTGLVYFQMFKGGTNWWGQTAPAVIPPQVCVQDLNARNAAGQLVLAYFLGDVTDEVDLTVADWDPANAGGTFTVAATSSDQVNQPALTVAGFGAIDPITHQFQVSDLAAPPDKVSVVSTRGGVATLDVRTGVGIPVSPTTPLRGIVIALPVVAIFASLLSSADVVFAKRLDDFIKLFNLENLPEYIFRLAYILIFAYALAGTFLHAAQSKDDKLIGVEKPLIPPFLGFTEAGIVLGSVIVLFAAFVAVQFQYFFGGQTNIHIEGYTYSEYARRGFGELVTVAFFSLLLLLGMGAVTRRETGRQRSVFSGLGVGMVVLVIVMLVSAYQRLVLYENAYGFSRLRTYTHVFMIWLGLLLVAVVVLEILHRERVFGFLAVLASLGFVISLSLLNVHAFIVNWALRCFHVNGPDRPAERGGEAC